MTIELTPEEANFLQSILGGVVPNMQVAAKDAPAILQMCQTILDKIQPKGE